MSIKEIFDDISLSVIHFLESHQGVSDVQFYELGGCSEMSIVRWERLNAPYKLPKDLKSFLFVSDGLMLRWNIMLISNDANNSIPLGHMHLNSLEEIVPYDFQHVDADIIGISQRDRETLYKFERLFVLDSKSDNGRVCLVYVDGGKNDAEVAKEMNHDTPQVWFQDLGLEWHFIASSFTEYFRLLIMHLGLPHWQYAFTSVGLDPLSKQWFRFLSPERLVIDLQRHLSSLGDHDDRRARTKKRKKMKRKVERHHANDGQQQQQQQQQQRQTPNTIAKESTMDRDKRAGENSRPLRWKKKKRSYKKKKDGEMRHHKLNLKKVTAALSPDDMLKKGAGASKM